MKSILDNKIGAARKTSPALIFIVLGVFAVIGILTFAVFFRPATQTQLGGGTQTTQGGTGGAATIVTTNPTIAFTGQEAQNIGTAVSPVGYRVSVNNGAFAGVVASGTGTAVPGQSDTFLLNSSGYHSAIVTGLAITPSVFPYTVQFDKNASVTEVIAYPYANTNIANGLGVNNITNAGVNGASYILNDHMYGTTQASTNDMLCLYELTEGVNATATGVQVSGAGITADAKYANSIPAWYTPAGVNSRVWGFDVPAIKSSGDTASTITLQTLPTKSFSAGDRLIKTCYTKENFIDSATGKLAYEVADSQSNAIQSLARYTFTGYFQ